jgi:hypothetical protein
MTTPIQTRPEGLVSKSPVSWNTLYISPEGFTCQLILSGESGQEVLEKARAAINSLLAGGCKPNGNHTSAPSSSNSNGSNAGNDYCLIHDCAMKRWEKNGRVWYSHKVVGTANEWCSGKPKRK